MEKRPLLLGHRGARATRGVPENSIASFDLAMAHGCDGFEFDVRRSADGRAVLCHDPVWRGTATGGGPGVEIAGASVAELAGIAQLREVVARFASAYLDIELKVVGLEAEVVQAVRAHALQRYVVSSFLPEALTQVLAVAAEVPIGLICDTAKQLAAWETLTLAAVIPHYKLVSRELVKELHAAGKQVLVWTVNEQSRMRKLAEWGVDGIISDETELLIKTLGP